MQLTSRTAVRQQAGAHPVVYVGQLALVAIAYWGAARLSLDLALVRGQVTPIWPPTGIALVTFLVLGDRMWPAIALSAFAVNLPLGPSPVAAALIAAGNTLAPLASATLLRRAGFRSQLDRLRDALAIVFLGALLGMTISATVGSAVLILSGAIPTSKFLSTWTVWWAGDATGVLLVAPMLLAFIPRPGKRALGWRRSAELTLLLCAIGVVTYWLFEIPYRLEYLVLPLIAVAAWRFRLAGAAPAALIASVIAARSAVMGTGPFTEESLLEKMITLQAFNVSMSLASFLLAAFADAHQRTEEMSRVILSAKVALGAKNDAIEVAGHELGPPIALVTSYLAVLSEGKLGPPPSKWRAILSVMNDKAWQVSRLIDELSEAARIDAETETSSPAMLDLREAVREAATRARPRADVAGAEITTTFGTEPVAVHADPRHVARILDNLIHNSLTYVSRPPRLKLEVEVDRDRAIVRVKDNGVGLTLAERARAFQPFHRTSNPAFSKIPGFGLGLYASRNLAEVNKGRLTLERTEEGVGSCFALELPIARSKPA
jgi:integral membrane sensor domain MASE1